MERKCITCKELKILDEFPVKDKVRGYRASRCKTCQRIASKNHYKANKKYYKSKSREFRDVIRKRTAERLIEYLKTHPCVDCGEADILVLEFDHVRGKKKNSISNMRSRGYSWECILEEIEKCEVRCCNCHRRRTYKLNNIYKLHI